MSGIAKIAISLALCLGLTSVVSLADISTSKVNLISFNSNNKYKNKDKGKPKVKVQNGLKGQYYKNIDFTNLKITRTDSRVNFDWEDKSTVPQLGNDTFSIRWTGQVQPGYTQTYTFHTIADDGVRLWINNQLVIDDWIDHAATENKGTINLEANKKYDIRLDYYQNKGDACIKLLWSSPSQVKEIIPKEKLFSEVGGTVQPPPVIPPVTPPVNDSQQVKVDLSAYFNEDAFSYDSKRSDGNYDSMNSSYSADLFTPNPVYDNTAYTTGSFDNGKNNSIHLNGQTIAVRQNKYESIRLLGSSTNGNKAGVVRINYTDGTFSYFGLSMKDWCTSDASGEKIVQTLAHRHSSTSDESIKNYVYACYLSPDKTKTVFSITMPDQKDMHVLAMTLLPSADVSSGNGNGLYGVYFDNANLTTAKLSRVDAAINFDWGLGSPASQIESDSFSVRWSGQVEPKYSETYTFYTSSDDGVRLWVNNVLLINDWVEHSLTEHSNTITLQAGTKYNIQLEYFENLEKAAVKLMWSSPSQSKEIIPKEKLYPEAGSIIQPPPVNPPQQVRVDLTAYFNEDAFSYDSKRSDGNYDGNNLSYSANLFTPNPVYDSTVYATGSLDDGKSNSIHLNGQTIAVVQNKYESIRLLGSATNGNKAGIARVNYTDGTFTYFSLSMKDWCTSDTTGEKVVQTMAHIHSSTGDEIINNYVYACYLNPDKTKTISSITMPDQKDMHILAITLLMSAQVWSGTGTGLNGEYFDNANLTTLKLNRVDTTVNFDWGQGSPTSLMESDSFSVRWSGQVEPKYSETYTFYTSSDDGVKLWVNNVLVINDWVEHSVTEHSGTITLSAGTKYNIKLEYFENLDKASVKLMWSSPSQSKEIIPATQLYH